MITARTVATQALQRLDPGIPWEPEAVLCLDSLSLGCPERLDRAGRMVLESVRAAGHPVVTGAVCGALAPALQEDLAYLFLEQRLQALRPAAIGMLTSLAEEEVPASVVDAGERLGITRSVGAQRVTRLIEEGLLERAEPGLVRFAIPGLREYLRLGRPEFLALLQDEP